MSFRNKSQARTLALQALCLYDALGDSFATQVLAFLRDPENLQDVGVAQQLSDDLLGFAAGLANGAWMKRGEYDPMLEAAAPDWAIKRMPPVDRNILRLGLHEWLTHPDTPFSVIVNEAIELARRFGGNDSPKFINGVLDGIRRKQAQPATPDQPDPQPSTQSQNADDPLGQVPPAS
ncbi:MAG: transcription antitermination factor NusB [Phycisphaerae bacterium]|nr:transcription antitermination factor NusB [Phycisphaerae bacterium]